MEYPQVICVTKHCRAIKHILIIEDTISLANHLKEKIDNHFSFHCDVAHTESAARDSMRRKRYDLIFNDIFLPDSTPDFIKELISNQHRVVVITGRDDDITRTKILSLPIVDYVVKTDAKTLVNYLIKTIERLHNNRDTVIGICDDSKLSRKLMIHLVETQNLGYVEFEDGQQALKSIVEDKLEVDLLLSDYEMPNMNGLELVRQLRHTFLEDELPFISLSASDRPHLLAQFLKSGANDYIKKPFTNEEFLTRLNLTLDHLYNTRKMVVLMKKLEQVATHDFLTQLYNRNYFYSQVSHVIATASREKAEYGILMIDIDYFKKVNDTYGHDAGDVAIKHVASLLKTVARASDYCCRWGGEEFLVLIPKTTANELKQFAERLRHAVEESTVVVSNKLSFKISISVGGAVKFDSDSQIIISRADEMLYEAKESGRNCVKISMDNDQPLH
jgi:diguanylate cyclase (GGDEF)-like protein